MISAEIHTYLERLCNLLRNELRRIGLEHGLQPIQIEALHYLSLCNRYSDTPMGVTEYLGQTKGTVSQTLKLLETKGYIARQADPGDKRLVHLRVTGAGDEIIQNAVPAPLFTQAGATLDPEIAGALRRLLSTLQQANGLKSFGVCHSCRFNQTLAEGGHRCGLTGEALSVEDIERICREHENPDQEMPHTATLPKTAL